MTFQPGDRVEYIVGGMYAGSKGTVLEVANHVNVLWDRESHLFMNYLLPVYGGGRYHYSVDRKGLKLENEYRPYDPTQQGDQEDDI